MARTARRTTTVLGLGAALALLAMLLLWQQVDAEACRDGRYDLAACTQAPSDVEQAAA
jgi:hypothetical protein